MICHKLNLSPEAKQQFFNMSDKVYETFNKIEPGMDSSTTYWNIEGCGEFEIISSLNQPYRLVSEATWSRIEQEEPELPVFIDKFQLHKCYATVITFDKVTHRHRYGTHGINYPYMLAAFRKTAGKFHFMDAISTKSDNDQYALLPEDVSETIHSTIDIAEYEVYYVDVWKWHLYVPDDLSTWVTTWIGTALTEEDAYNQIKYLEGL